MLARHNIRFVSLLPKKIASFRQHVKDDLGQNNRDVYNIPYNCLMKEHHWHIHLTRSDLSAVAEHSFNVEHCLQLQDTQIFTSTLLHGSECQGVDTWYCNKEDGLVLNKSCKPLIHIFPDVTSLLGHWWSCIGRDSFSFFHTWICWFPFTCPLAQLATWHLPDFCICNFSFLIASLYFYGPQTDCF